MSDSFRPWDMRVDGWDVADEGRTLNVRLTLTNLSPVASIPDPRRLQPTLHGPLGEMFGLSDLFRPEGDSASIFRPVIQPGASARVRVAFAAPADLTDLTLSLAYTVCGALALAASSQENP